jgi:hypothetical protein
MEYLYTVLILVGIYTILASSFNLIIGFGGLISIAHPIFFALAAYCSAILNLRLGVPIPLAIVAGTLFATAMSVMLSLPSLRVSGRLPADRQPRFPARLRRGDQEHRVRGGRERPHRGSNRCIPGRCAARRSPPRSGCLRSRSCGSCIG